MRTLAYKDIKKSSKTAEQVSDEAGFNYTSFH